MTDINPSESYSWGEWGKRQAIGSLEAGALVAGGLIGMKMKGGAAVDSAAITSAIKNGAIWGSGMTFGTGGGALYDYTVRPFTGEKYISELKAEDTAREEAAEAAVKATPSIGKHTAAVLENRIAQFDIPR